ncbi:hypothetical protein CEUSTIGMA_g7925.t1 [Chlamydomonas eustigma]|uniref:Uncharacterized protein n=1 Tax=Chlamydomonas eustigma TaxID=1157962 RepID=A0A250XBN0_9CHLO|nr:hypothetical protein CEUSTIGMA_g7925.t1 [Chlamydomonas eustigma]|eukprot:GAX80487.1 hypothetical protein CEUSTIGMA_g7925.t1 [Chlamydomonas eustigma]
MHAYAQLMQKPWNPSSTAATMVLSPHGGDQKRMSMILAEETVPCTPSCSSSPHMTVLADSTSSDMHGAPVMNDEHRNMRKWRVTHLTPLDINGLEGGWQAEQEAVHGNVLLVMPLPAVHGSLHQQWQAQVNQQVSSTPQTHSTAKSFPPHPPPLPPPPPPPPPLDESGYSLAHSSQHQLHQVPCALHSSTDDGWVYETPPRPYRTSSQRFGAKGDQSYSAGGAAVPISHLAAVPISHLAAVPISHLAAVPISHLAAAPISHLAAVPISHLAAVPISHLAAATSRRSSSGTEAPLNQKSRRVGVKARGHPSTPIHTSGQNSCRSPGLASTSTPSQMKLGIPQQQQQQQQQALPPLHLLVAMSAANGRYLHYNVRDPVTEKMVLVPSNLVLLQPLQPVPLRTSPSPTPTAAVLQVEHQGGAAQLSIVPDQGCEMPSHTGPALGA